MALAKKEGRHLFISFFAVQKAYDKADMNDMLYVLHKNGFKGKLWHLTQSLNQDLTAKVKTKAGLTREIKRERGGKQGGKLMVPMFAKTMDTLAEDMMENENLGIRLREDHIPALLFMDDVMTFAEGYDQQQQTLEAVTEFGLKHRIEWGENKCKVLECGTHKESKTEWPLGEKTIQTCQDYKYLGEVITRDGKNEDNLISRFHKVKAAVRAINTCGKNNIMKKIEIKLLITLHNAVTLPTLLYNAETWPLNASIRKEINKMEIWAWKSMLGLPKTTPNAAIIFCTGALYASIRIETKQLLYLHKILQKPEYHWTIQSLYAIKDHNIGWARQILGILETWGLEEDWNSIKQKTYNTWKSEVHKAAEKKNRDKIREDCLIKTRGEEKMKTKTKTIIPQLDASEFQRKPEYFMDENNKLIARAYIMGRYGMLQCASNFSTGYGGKICSQCDMIDDENHRINFCKVWKGTNLADCNDKVAFEDLYSGDILVSMPIAKKIIDLWDLGNGRNCMRIE